MTARMTGGQRRAVKLTPLVIVLALVTVFGLGFFAGQEYFKWQLREAVLGGLEDWGESLPDWD